MSQWLQRLHATDHSELASLAQRNAPDGNGQQAQSGVPTAHVGLMEGLPGANAALTRHAEPRNFYGVSELVF
ncbi:hypothetical protein CFAM422_009343 [Trichoderma lentiforme]|uniref:Uncharacterized protein n=1 Tax=Trichoderma lentiforme TaxID=1567552 RepID=A0A9P4X9I2_9HYPO|nr:hypothetical protein CFAM422_009343 [Trichoderma lentiforme]